LFALAFYPYFPKRAHAFNLGGLIGSVINSAAQQNAINSQLKYYENRGREELFANYKNSYLAMDDPRLNALLSDVVEQLSFAVAKEDISIIERPYNYFIVPEEEFNAFCSLGHVLAVNSGTFVFVRDDPDQLAAVVAHEMIHGQKNHVFKGVRKQMSALFARNVIASQAGSYAEGLLLDVITLNVIAKGIHKPNEWEADNLSFGYLTAAGYNPGAPAALWQHAVETASMNNSGKNILKSVLNPSTHPRAKERRDNFAKKLTEYSNNAVAVDPASGQIRVKGVPFIIPAAAGTVSGAERAYMIAGRLAALYHAGIPPEEARAQERDVFVGERFLMTAEEGDVSAPEVAALFNSIK
jgi:predicted Zn-dependent protease